MVYFLTFEIYIYVCNISHESSAKVVDKKAATPSPPESFAEMLSMM